MSTEARIQQLETDIDNIQPVIASILSTLEQKTGQELGDIFPTRIAEGISRTGGSRTTGTRFNQIATGSILQSEIDNLQNQMSNIHLVIQQELQEHPEIFGNIIVDGVNDAVASFNQYYTSGGVDTAITDAVATATAGLQTNIDNEATARTNADNTLTTNLNAEIAARTTATNQNASDITALTTSLNTTTTNLLNDFGILQTNVTNADNNLQSQIDIINTDISTNNGANQLLRLDALGLLPNGVSAQQIQRVREYDTAVEMNAEPAKFTDVIYITKNDNLIYRWNGLSFQILNLINYPVTGVNSKTGNVVINPDDLDDTATTNKFVTAPEKADIALISGLSTQQTTNTNDISTNTANITTNTNDIATLTTNLNNHTHTLLNLTDTPANYTGHANKLVKVKATEDGVEFVTESVGNLPPSTVAEADYYLRVDAFGNAEWRINDAGGGGTVEYVPNDNFIRATTNVSGYSYITDSANQLFGNDLTGLDYFGIWYDNNTEPHNFSTANTTTKQYISFQMTTGRAFVDQGFAIFIMPSTLDVTDGNIWQGNSSGRILIVRSGTANSGILFDGAYNPGNGVEVATGTTGDATFDGRMQTAIDSYYRFPQNYKFSLGLDNTTKTATLFIHAPNGSEIKQGSYVYSGKANLDNIATLKLGVKLGHSTFDTSATQQIKILKASEAPTIAGYEYLYPGDVGGGGITLPILQTDVTGLVSSLASKEPLLPSKVGNANKYLKINSGETAFEYGVPSGALPTVDGTTTGKYLTNDGNNSSWGVITIPASLPILNLPANSVPSPNTNYYVGSDGTNYTWRLKDTANLSNYATTSYVDSNFRNNTYITTNHYTKSETIAEADNRINLLRPYIIPDPTTQNGKYLRTNDGINLVWDNALSAYLDILPVGTSTTSVVFRHSTTTDFFIYEHVNNMVKIPKILNLQNNSLQGVSLIKMNSDGSQIQSADSTQNFGIYNVETKFYKNIHMNSNDIQSCNSVQAGTIKIDNIQTSTGINNITHTTLKNRVDGNFSGIQMTASGLDLSTGNLLNVGTLNGYNIASLVNTNNYTGQTLTALNLDCGTGTVQGSVVNAGNLTVAGAINSVTVNNTKLNELMTLPYLKYYQVNIPALSPSIEGILYTTHSESIGFSVPFDNIVSVQIYIQTTQWLSPNVSSFTRWCEVNIANGITWEWNANNLNLNYKEDTILYSNKACKVKLCYKT